MKRCIAFLCLTTAYSRAEPTVSTLEWRPACDGSTIEIVSEEQEIRSVHASAYHSASIIRWAIHYLNGIPISAEYRELVRNRIPEGDRAGEYSGDNPVKRIKTWRWEKGAFPIQDEALYKELEEILLKARSEVSQAPADK